MQRVRAPAEISGHCYRSFYISVYLDTTFGNSKENSSAKIDSVSWTHSCLRSSLDHAGGSFRGILFPQPSQQTHTSTIKVSGLSRNTKVQLERNSGTFYAENLAKRFHSTEV